MVVSSIIVRETLNLKDCVFVCSAINLTTAIFFFLFLDLAATLNKTFISIHILLLQQCEFMSVGSSCPLPSMIG